ncbi:MAG: hypothetical protein ACM3KM_00290 [Acidobacteriaceae bacterium]
MSRSKKIWVGIFAIAIAVAAYFFVPQLLKKQAPKNAPEELAIQPADSFIPAAGICMEPDGIYASITINSDSPNPRCMKVSSEQFLTVINKTDKPTDLKFNGLNIASDVKPGATFTFNRVFADYLAPGVHDLFINGYAAEIWVRPSRTQEARVRDFVDRYLTTYKDGRIVNNFDNTKKFISRAELARMQTEQTPIETNYTSFIRFEILTVDAQEKGFVVRVKLFDGSHAVLAENGLDVFEIPVFMEDGELKTDMWYFTQ